MDEGQRDSFYDIGRIVRKAKPIAPTGQLLIIYDYFIHAGQKGAFTADSYNTAINQTYKRDFTEFSRIYFLSKNYPTKLL